MDIVFKDSEVEICLLHLRMKKRIKGIDELDKKYVFQGVRMMLEYELS